MTGVLSNEQRHEQMQLAIGRFPMLTKKHAFGHKTVSIACYGPSLADTWKTIPRENPIISVSGAHDFLRARDIIPRFHVEIDPRPHKPKMLHPNETVTYLMASCCHPDFWDILHGYEVKLWHLINGNDYETVDWVSQHHPAGLDSMIGGGSSVGQRAMNVAAALGYRCFDIFGMDCSFTDKRHAGWHSGESQPVVQALVNNKTFITTPQLLQYAQEMREFLLTQDADVTFHGDGMMQEIAKRIQRRKA